jgi:hypothetical protein
MPSPCQGVGRGGVAVPIRLIGAEVRAVGQRQTTEYEFVTRRDRIVH